MGAASRSLDTELEGSLLPGQLLPLGEGEELLLALEVLSFSTSCFTKPPFLPVKVIFLSKIIYEWKTVCSRRAPPTHTNLPFPQ